MTDATHLEQPALPPEIPDSNDAELISERNQRLIAIGAVLGSLMLAAQHVLIASHVHGWITSAVSVTSLVGWVLFGIGMILNVRLKRTPEGRAFSEHAARDERIIAIRAKSFAFGFAAMMLFQVVLIVLSVVLGHLETELLSVPVVAPATVAVGVIGAVLRFQILSNR